MQVVEPMTPQKVTLADLEHVDPARRETEAMARATAELRTPFRLDQAPLFRAVLLRLSPAEHLLVVVMHHIISDDWSMGVLVREVASLYRAFTAGQPSPLVNLPIQYAEYAVWQRDRLQGETLERLLNYWHEHLQGVAPLRVADRSAALSARRAGGRDAHGALALGAGRAVATIGTKRRGDALHDTAGRLSGPAPSL